MDLLDSLSTYDLEWETFDDFFDSFAWRLPPRFNIGGGICDRWGESAERIAIRTVDFDSESTAYTYRRLARESDQLANYLSDAGVERGDRVVVHTTQRPEAVVAHLATWKIGAVSVVLNPLLSSAEIADQLAKTDPTACVLDPAVLDPTAELKSHLESLDPVVVVDKTGTIAGRAYADAIAERSTQRRVAETTPDDDAFVVFTSGTTGDPKGAVHTHSTLLGHLSTFCLTFTNLDYEGSQRFWTVSNWASITLMSNVMAPLFAGKTVVAHARTDRFDPEEALAIVDNYRITNLSASPTALRMIQQVPDIRSRYDLNDLHLITTGGEEVSQSLVEWWERRDVTVHEVYGQTEANNVVGDCSALLDLPPDAIGRPMPGHVLGIVDPEDPNIEIDSGELGEIAIRYDDPICFDRYWENPEQTAETIRSGWLLTGDLGYRNGDGEIFFGGRKDDVIITSGYRIGPAEIEEALAVHPEVIDAGVVGVEDEIRGEIPKAFVELRRDERATETLVDKLQKHVKDRTAKYKYPREIEFIETVPKTNTGTTARGELRKRASEREND